MPTYHRTALVAVTLLSGVAAVGSAQTVGLSAVSATTDHDLLAGRLFGPAARVSFPIGNSGIRIGLGAETVSGATRRVGSTCVGLVPEPCPDEPLRDDGRLSAVTGGFGLRLLDRGRVQLDVTMDVQVGHARSETRGQTSGRRLSADKALWGGGIGLDASWSPWKRLPLALEAGVTTGILRPTFGEQIIDGYSPFEQDFAVKRLRLGVAWAQSPR